MVIPSHFYAIADTSGGHDPVELSRMLLEGGAQIIQLRLKNAAARDFLRAARAIVPLCRAHGAILIVNDRADVALLCDADGVHLGQEDLPLGAARRLLGPRKTIGISTHSVADARAAEAGGADYVGFGPMFPGGVKETKMGQGLERLGEVRAAVKLPIVAIGGITEATMPAVLAAGADAAAIITDVVRVPDVTKKVRALLALNPPGRAG